MKKLTKTQMDALSRFAQAGGHGYGSYAYLPTPTARALARMGLVRLGWVPSLDTRSRPVGVATEAGMIALSTRYEWDKTVRPVPTDPYGFRPAPEGWLP